MSIGKIKLRPLKLDARDKAQVRTQFGALCYRVRKDRVQVLLITSRGTGRWVIPKGWPVPGATPDEAALREAWEEGGIEGKVRGNTLGIYSYIKRDAGLNLPCVVAVFAVKVKAVRDRFPEAGQRRRKWVSPDKAATMVQEPELRQILAAFDPRAVG